MECIEVKIYTKKELVLLYFPDSMPETATKHLMRWVRRNNPLIQELEATNYKINQKWLTKKQVEIIFRHIGPP